MLASLEVLQRLLAAYRFLAEPCFAMTDGLMHHRLLQRVITDVHDQYR
jgi:hypothetical protein